MLETLLSVLCLALGATAGVLWARARAAEREERLRADAAAREESLRGELDQARAAAGEAREAVARAVAERETLKAAARDEAEQRKQMEQAFAAHAAKAGDDLMKRFLDVAGTRFASSEKSAAEALEQRKLAIEQLMKPLTEKLGKLDVLTRDIEGKREKAYGQLGEQLTNLMGAVGDVHQSSRSLSDALRGSSQARGDWGEMALRNIVEMAGMTRNVDFNEQSQDSAGRRPDMVVRLPGGDLIPVDAKTLWKDFEAACSTSDPGAREASLASHVASVREVVRALKKKDYASAVEGRVDFTVMFVPSEAVVAAAFTHDPRIFEWALAQSVLIATPATLMALLRTIYLFWREDDLAEDSRAVWKLATEYHKRTVTLFGHLKKVGEGLARTQDSYNAVVGSFSRRVLPAGRELEQKVSPTDSSKRLPALELLDQPIREASGFGVPALPSAADMLEADVDIRVAEAGPGFRSRIGPVVEDDESPRPD